MTIKYVVGNLFNHLPSQGGIIIPHVCNDKGAWGAGFVLPLARKFPEAKDTYINGCSYGNRLILGDVQFVGPIKNVTIANMIAQTLGGKRPLYYNKLAECMDFVGNYCVHPTHDEVVKIFAPKFGAGLAGGNWEFIKELIEDCWIRRGIDVTIFSLT